MHPMCEQQYWLCNGFNTSNSAVDWGLQVEISHGPHWDIDNIEISSYQSTWQLSIHHAIGPGAWIRQGAT